jgi:hypothetical protein
MEKSSSTGQKGKESDCGNLSDPLISLAVEKRRSSTSDQEGLTGQVLLTVLCVNVAKDDTLAKRKGSLGDERRDAATAETRNAESRAYFLSWTKNTR